MLDVKGKSPVITALKDKKHYIKKVTHVSPARSESV